MEFKVPVQRIGSQATYSNPLSAEAVAIAIESKISDRNVRDSVVREHHVGNLTAAYQGRVPRPAASGDREVGASDVKSRIYSVLCVGAVVWSKRTDPRCTARAYASLKIAEGR